MKNDDILFLGPSILFMFFFVDPDELSQIVEPLKFDQKRLIFFPINNNQDFDQPGGTHWSLLVFEKEQKIFHYSDSAGTSNKQYALSIVEKTLKLLRLNRKEISFQT